MVPSSLIVLMMIVSISFHLGMVASSAVFVWKQDDINITVRRNNDASFAVQSRANHLVLPAEVRYSIAYSLGDGPSHKHCP